MLVHGLWMHGAVMALLARRVARCGYRVRSYSYPSMRLGLAPNAQRLAAFCRGLGAARLHFVAHSLGGLVVLRALDQLDGIAIGRVVMLGSPYGGSHAAGRLARLPGGHRALGRSVQEWLDGPRTVPDGRAEIGVIAGRLPVGLGALVAPDLPAPSDGAVSVAETRVPGMRDHIVLDVSHSGMLLSRAVARQAAAFLRDGAFAHEA